MRALNTRVLQTELMVAALSCSQHVEYNAFIRQFQPQLSGQAGALRSLFRRQHGSAGETRMNAFITRLANDASQRSINVFDTYCTSTADLFQRALDTAPSGFDGLTKEPWIVERHGYQACTTTASAAAAPRAKAAAPAQKQAVAKTAAKSKPTQSASAKP